MRRSWSRWKNACEAWRTCSPAVSCEWYVVFRMLIEEAFRCCPQMEHNDEKMDAKLDMIQRSRLLNKVPIPRSEGGYSDSIADSIDSDVGPLRMSDLGEGEYDDMISSVAGVCDLHLHCGLS